MWVPAIAGFLTAPFMVAQYMVGNAYVSLAIGIIPAMLMYAYLAPKLAIAQSIVPSNLRALVSASIVFTAGLVGTVLAPLLTGMVSDWLIRDFGMQTLSLRYAILSACPVGLAGAWLMLRGANYLRDEMHERMSTATPEPSLAQA